MPEAPTTRPSRLYRLIEDRLDCTLAEFVAARRADTSWKAIADELHEHTGVEVSWESLRSWFADRIRVEVTIDEPAAGSAA